MKLEDAEVLAELWIDHHGLDGWRFRFDSAKRRFGRCTYSRRLITLSRHLTELNEEAEVEDVILHEIAHALAGPGAGHGPRWRDIAASIGAEPKRCYSLERVRRPPAPLVGVCPWCGHSRPGHRRRDCSCGRCSRTYDARYRIVWRKRSEVVNGQQPKETA